MSSSHEISIVGAKAIQFDKDRSVADSTAISLSHRTILRAKRRGLSAFEIFYYALLLYSLVILFILPAGSGIRHAVVALPMFGGFLAILLLNKKIAIVDVLIVCILLVLALIVGHYDTISDAITLSILLLFFSALRREPPGYIRANRVLLHVFGWLAFASLALQLYQNFGAPGYWGYTSTLSVGDTNFSGLYVLLFLYFSQRSGFWPGIILALVAMFLFLSRTYFLAIVVFLVLLLFKEKLRFIFASLNFVILIIILNIALMIYAGYILRSIGVSDFYAVRGIERLVSFDDRSATVRLQYNYLLLEDMLQNPGNGLLGQGQKFEESATRLLGKVPHNTFMSLVGVHGLLFTVFYLIVLSVLFRKLNWKNEGFVYVVPIIVYSLFLHGVLSKAFVIFLVLLLEIQIREKLFGDKPL